MPDRGAYGGRHRAARPASPMRWAAAAVGLVVLLGSAGTGATWTDRATIPGGDIHSGAIDLRADGVDSSTTFSALDVSGLLPGGSTATVVSVENVGTAPLTWSTSLSASGGSTALLSALVLTVTGAASTTSSDSGRSCGGAALPGTGGSLEPGESTSACVELRLPAGASSALAGALTTVALTFTADGPGAWTDQASLTGSRVATQTLTAPVARCGSGLIGSLTVTWAAVPGATGYRLRSTLLGQDPLDVDASTLSKTLTGITGALGDTFTVQAIYGSSGWVSPESNKLNLTLLTGVLGQCSG